MSYGRQHCSTVVRSWSACKALRCFPYSDRLGFTSCFVAFAGIFAFPSATKQYWRQSHQDKNIDHLLLAPSCAIVKIASPTMLGLSAIIY